MGKYVDEELEESEEVDENVSLIGAQMFALLEDMKNVPAEESHDAKEDYERLERPGIMHKIAALYVQGFTYTQIAAEFNVRPASIRAVTKRDGFKAIVDALGEEIMMACRSFLKTGAITATGVLLDSMASRDEKVKLQAANSVLDRVGLKSANTVELKATVNALSSLNDEELMAQIMKDYNAPAPLPSYAREVIEIGNDSGNETGSQQEESL